MFFIGGEPIVEIGAESQDPVFPLTDHIHFDHGERRVFDLDHALFGRGFQPVAAIRVTAENSREQPGKFLSPNRRAALEPCTVPRDPDGELTAAIGRQLHSAHPLHFGPVGQFISISVLSSHRIAIFLLY
jgi:hypothetical protein